MMAPTPKAMINPMVMRLRSKRNATSAPSIKVDAPTKPQNAASGNGHPHGAQYAASRGVCEVTPRTQARHYPASIRPHPEKTQ